MLPEIAPMLRNLPNSVSAFTPAALADYFTLPPQNFHQRGPGAPIQFHQGSLTNPVGIFLRGTIFWPHNKQVVRGVPRILSSSDYTSSPAAVAIEAEVHEALDGHDGAIEVMESGVGIRVYAYRGVLHCATDVSFSGDNPLTAAGIDNARALGIDYATQAKRLFDSDGKRAASLARHGYVLVFNLLLPERETVIPAERPDLVLVDVVDPDHCFVDRLEKERIAEDYGLRVATLHGRMHSSTTPAEFYSRLRSLEHIAARDDVAGFVVKTPWRHDQLSIEILPPSIRQAWYAVDEADIRSVYEAILADFGTISPRSDLLVPLPPPIDDPDFLIEMILDYLDASHRSVRWQVMQWLDRLAGAPGDAG